MVGDRVLQQVDMLAMLRVVSSAFLMCHKVENFLLDDRNDDHQFMHTINRRRTGFICERESWRSERIAVSWTTVTAGGDTTEAKRASVDVCHSDSQSANRQELEGVSHSNVTDMPLKNCSRIDKALQWDMIANASLFKLVLTFYEREQHLTLQTGYVALGSALSGEELGPTHFSHNAALHAVLGAYAKAGKVSTGSQSLIHDGMSDHINNGGCSVVVVFS
uniref:KR domain-containing protein n=1 Tax=Ascaris lumbricoides TaxID=6252 RepID=A0A0M3IMG3_ASCLU